MNTFIKDIRDGVKGMKWYEWVMAAVMVAIAGLAVYNGFTDPNSYNPGWLTIINFISAVCGVFCVFLFVRIIAIGLFSFLHINTKYDGIWNLNNSFEFKRTISSVIITMTNCSFFSFLQCSFVNFTGTNRSTKLRIVTIVFINVAADFCHKLPLLLFVLLI